MKLSLITNEKGLPLNIDLFNKIFTFISYKV